MKHRATLIAATLALGLALATSSASAAGPPKVTEAALSHLGTDSVVLEAEVDPQGKATSYRFEYGPGDCSANPCTALPGPTISGLSPAKAVTTVVEGLTPGATYHFRVVATNSLGEAESPDIAFTTYVLEPVFGPCANDEPFRSGPSARLPDCRAYEQASPVDKNGADINGAANAVQASTDGDAVTFFSAAGLPGAVGAQDFSAYLARRGEGNWATQGVYPPAENGAVARNAGWTPDLSQFFSSAAPTFSGPWTFRLRSSADGSFTPISEGADRISFLAGASADGSVVYFQNDGQLLPAAAPEMENLYVWDRDTGTVSLAGVLPDSACGTPPCIPPGGSFAGPYSWFEGSLNIGNKDYYIQNQHTISADGTKAYFTAGGGQIYLRRNATSPAATTIHVSASRRAIPDINGTRPAAFMAATPDGSKAFLTSPEKLTDDATTGPEPSIPAIASANVGDGSGKDLDFLPTHAKGVAVDGEFIYWANPGADTIGRADINGTPASVKEDFITGADNPQYVAVDASHIYWTNAGDEKDGHGSIGRAEIDGKPASVEEEFIPGEIETTPGEFEMLVSNPRGITVDAEHIYWANSGSAEATTGIMRTNITGGDAELFGQSSEGPVHWDAFDLAINGTQLYFTRGGGGSDPADNFGCVERVALAEPKDFHAMCDFGGSTFQGIAIDASHIYWANSQKSNIGRANLDLTSPDQEFIKEAGHPEGLAVDAGHIYWSANQELLPNPGNDLYRFDADTGDLSDITIDKTDVNGAEVKGILGISDDGSYVYFVANGVPDGTVNSPNGRGESAALGNCQGTGDSNNLNFSGECNLYLRHGAETTFIARLDAADGSFSDAANWEPAMTAQSARENTARASADGQTLLFRSQRQLGAYPNNGVPELYRYQAGETAPSCISCNPTGTAPVAKPSLQSIEPYLPVVKPPGRPAILTRNLSSDGNRVFFESVDKLVVADVNGEEGCPLGGQAEVPICRDVYEWEAQGSGSCESAEQNGGCLYLLSSGTGSEPAFFADASASGDDAFIFTRESLVPQDQDQIQDVYDVRSGGGLASQYQVAPVPCEGEACKGAAGTPPTSQSPGTGSFSGPGNPQGRKPKPRCPKGKRKARSHGKPRCVSRHQKRSDRGHRDANPTRKASR